MVYIVDIDGTICSSTDSKYEEAEPIQSRIEYFNKLYEEGHVIMYWTARGMGRFKGNKQKAISAFYAFTEKQLKGWNVKYSELRLGKPSYDFWVDDKALMLQDI